MIPAWLGLCIPITRFATDWIPHLTDLLLFFFFFSLSAAHSAQPIISTIEVLTGLDARAVSDNPSLIGFSGMSRGLLRVAIRVLTMVSFVAMAILFPFFDRVMALLGSAMCFTICVILPLLFHLRIFGRDISLRERVLDYALIAVSSVLAVVGTVWVFLPW